MTALALNLSADSLVPQHQATALRDWSQKLRDQATLLCDRTLLQRRQFRTQLTHRLLSHYERQIIKRYAIPQLSSTLAPPP
jgi:hypothetical protein